MEFPDLNVFLSSSSATDTDARTEPEFTTPRVIIHSHFKSVQERLAKQRDADSKRDAEYLKRAIRGADLVDDAKENFAVALICTAMVVARSAPPDMTPEQMVSFLTPSAGRHAASLPGVVATAIDRAKNKPALFPSPARVINTEPTLEEFVLKKSGDDAGQPVPGAEHNFRAALQMLGVTFRYNEFKADDLYVRDGNESPVEDHHIKSLTFEIERKYRFYPPKDKFFDFCETVARENSFHPVKEYLDALPPDAAPGSPANLTETWLIRYAGAEDTPYVRAVSRIPLIAAVRRVREPGCVYQEMLVLESPQGKGKSSAIRALVPNDEWFTSDFKLDPDDSKKMMEQTVGHWIIENEELRGMSVHDRNALKAYLSRLEDKSRMAYGRKTKAIKRQFIIIGTTNDAKYLDDPNGEDRRFWPVTVKEFDVQGLAAIRDQLWAEAARLEAEGASTRLPRELWPAAAAEQAKRRVEDPFEDPLDDKLGGLYGRISLSDVKKLLGFHEEKHPTSGENQRIGKVMRILGFEYAALSNGTGGKTRYYVRARNDEERKIRLEVVGSSGSGWRVKVVIPSELAPASQVPPRPDHLITN